MGTLCRKTFRLFLKLKYIERFVLARERGKRDLYGLSEVGFLHLHILINRLILECCVPAPILCSCDTYRISLVDIEDSRSEVGADDWIH